MLKHVYLRLVNAQKYLNKQKGSSKNVIVKQSCLDKTTGMNPELCSGISSNEKEMSCTINLKKDHSIFSDLNGTNEVEKIKNEEKKDDKDKSSFLKSRNGGKRCNVQIVGKDINKIYEKEVEALHESNNKKKELDRVLEYASEQIQKSLFLNPYYVNSQEFYMSLSLICNQLAINGYREKSFWCCLSVKLTELLKLQNIYETMCIRWLALILNSFARIPYRNDIFLQNVTKFILNYPNEDMHGFDISQIVNSYAKLGYLDVQVFKFFVKYILEKKKEMSCQSLSNICNAYSKMNHFENLFFQLSTSIKQKADEFNDQEIANIVNSYSKLQKIDVQLFDQFIHKITNRIFCFKPVEIVMIANAYAKCNIYKKVLFDNITMYILQKQRQFTPVELSILANSYGKLNLKEMKVFDVIKKGLIEKENLLGPGNVAMLLHAYGKLAIRESIFLNNLIKKKKHLIPKIDCRNLTLIYVAVIKLNLDIPISIYNSMKYAIITNIYKFTDLALVSIAYSSLFHKYFDLTVVSYTLIVLDKRKAQSKSFAHQIQVILFVLNSFYNFSKFSYRFLICLHNLLQRASLFVTQDNYYDINKSSIQKKILPYLPQSFHILTEVSVGPFVIDFLLLHKSMHNYTHYVKRHRSLK